jgi:peptidoglycan/xylan/chitin deacetylase (PgdA/CDA1 family)
MRLHSRRGVLRRLVFRCLRFSILPYVIRETIQRRRVTILLYHNPDSETLRVHLQALRRRYSIISLRELVVSIQNQRMNELPPKSLVLTLDDGYRENCKLTPLLESEGIPVTIFLCSGIVGTNRRFWFKFAETREDLKQLSDSDRIRALYAMGFRDSTEYPHREALSDSEIRQMHGQLIDFQSHTISHPILPRCTAEKAATEIIESRSDLERRYELDIFALAYPNGDYSDRDALLVKQAGYTCALTADPGFNTMSTNLFRLKRIAIDDDDDVDELLVKASGLWPVLSGFVRSRRYGFVVA